MYNKRLIERINTFKDLPDDWYGVNTGYKIWDSSIVNTLEFVNKFDFELPIYVFPTGNNGVQFECRLDPDDYIEIEFISNNICVFSKFKHIQENGYDCQTLDFDISQLDDVCRIVKHYLEIFNLI